MQISTTTTAYIEAVNTFSGGRLKRAGDCALLWEAAALNALDADMSELCFTAKFLHKTSGLMMKIGAAGEGYDKLSIEFEANAAKARQLLERIVGAMPDEEERERFTQAYLALTAPAFGSMMELVHDLNWMKNYSLETKAPT